MEHETCILALLGKMKTVKNNKEKRFGRPQLGAEKRRCRIAASFTLEERNQILEIAECCGLSPSEVLHRAALLLKIKPPMPKIDLEAIRVINEINKNFQLLLKMLETGHPVDTTTVDQYFRILAGLKLVIMEKQ